MANIRILVVIDKSMSDVDDDIGVAHLPGGNISDYETLCGACNTARVYKDTVGRVTCTACLDTARSVMENMTDAEIKELRPKRRKRRLLLARLPQRI